ncbi:glycosyltransferase [Cyclobacterium xiamenense]|uniref:glycosyltransferase n=1 Tax=Cyclobacterium xiamenense TaxID=1297121 RepID=UPI0012B991AE|nr:glycosyltransferase [Cyclobacterium xiamenense]
MPTCSVSVIVPIQAYTPFLEESLKGTISCLHTGMELVLVDERMDPRCQPFVNEALTHPQVRMAKARGAGLVNGLLTGLAAARGTYIARMDADDFCLGDRFAVQQQYLDANPEVGLVSCRVRYGGDPSKNPGFARFVSQVNDLDTHEKMESKRYAEAVVIHPSVMFRRELLNMASYRERNEMGQAVPEDFDLWLRWMNQGVRFAKLEECLLVWNDWEGRLSRSHPAYAKRAFREAAAEAFVAPEGRPIWICGYGRTVERRLAPFRRRGLKPAGYLALTPELREDQLPVITPAEAGQLRGKALLLVMVGNMKGKRWIQNFLDAESFTEGQDYLWMV